MLYAAPTALLAAAVLTGGCVYSDVHLEEGEQTMAVEHVIDSGLVVATKNGSVKVHQADVPDVQIVAHIKAHTFDRIDAFRIDAQHQADGNLHIRALWPDGRRLRNESCSFEITIPSANGVDITSDNGAITITGLGGEAKIVTDNGRITITDHNGPVDAETDNGHITINNVPYPVQAVSDNGGIDLIGVGSPVTVRTDNGRITIKLNDDATGPVNATSDNGSVTLSIGEAFEGQLDIYTDNGSISVTDIRGANVTEASKHHMRIVIGESSNKSRLETDNGSVRVNSGG